MVLQGSGGWREQPVSLSPPAHTHPLNSTPTPTNLYPPSTSSHSETRTHSLSELHTTLRHSICMPAPSSLDALRLVIKGIDPLNLYELQFVPAARPVRGLREAGTSARGVCACCFAVVKERGKGFYSSSSELLTSREEALWQEEQGWSGVGGLHRRWWLHANLHFWVLRAAVEALLFVKPKDTQSASDTVRVPNLVFFHKNFSLRLGFGF